MSILFINGSPNPNGNTTRLASQLLEGKTYDTIELGTTKVYDYGQDFADDQFDEVVQAMMAADTIVFGSPMYWHSFSGMLRNLLDRCYGPIQDEFAGKRLFFVFQGGAPTKEQLDTAEWTISRFAGLYQMTYEGMVTNAREARAAAARM
ncbi:MAG: NAD(P)H-dependent oxidoreductase [Atopobiaceae bacterium]|nr:NAD(P)H-dependent oxidoreductase [Atopobiaceae bacterium]